MANVIAHSLWRSCSTYLWNKARSSDGCIAYYEPFHQLLSGKVRRIESGSVKGGGLRHPEVLNYFAEVTTAYERLGLQEFPQHSGEWNCGEFFLYSDAQRRHIANLTRNVLESKVANCFWSFNRGISKISTIHDSISALSGTAPISLLIYREPSQQLASFMYQSAKANYWFEARSYAFWLANQLVLDLVPEEFGALARLSQLVADDPAAILPLLPCRIELSAYLYSCTLIKSLILSLRGWATELQSLFMTNDCFLVDAFACSDERLRFTSRIAQGGISIELDDFHLEPQKPFLCSDKLAIALSCALKNIMPEMPANSSLAVVSDYFRRISEVNSSYSLLMQANLAFNSLTTDEADFMEHVKSQAEDFVLIADNKHLRHEIASINEDNQRLNECHAELLARVDSLEHQKVECVKDLEQRLNCALEDLRQALLQLEDSRRESERLARACEERTQAAKNFEERLASITREIELERIQLRNSLSRDLLIDKFERIRAIGKACIDG